MMTVFTKFRAAVLAIFALSVAGGSAFGANYDVPAGTPDYVRAAVESSDRPEAHRERDANRKPAEILTLSEVAPGDRVIEFAAFGQYYTTLLSDIVGPDGMAYMLDLPYTEERAGEASRAFAADHANADYRLVDYNTVELPQNVDVVFNVLYYHDLAINDIDTADLNKRIYEALKPGGVFLLVDHNAEPGSGRRDSEELHRIDPDVVKKEVTAAGFELVEESDLLANEGDDHKTMVFAPDTRGETDRTVFKFRKPSN